MKISQICFFCLFLVVVSSQAAVHETLPTFHWAYDDIKVLQDRGFLLELNPLQLPYTRGEVARELSGEEEKIKALNSAFVTHIYEKLQYEFMSEATGAHITGRARLEANLDDEPENNAAYRGIYRAGAGAQIGEHVFAYSGVNFDQYDYHDPLYKGDKWRGIAGYTEQAYVRVNWDRFDVLIGRDFLRWGPGETGSLVLSNHARPLDQLRARARFGPFDYMFVISELDPMNGLARDSSRFTARRYLSGHRLGLSLFENRFRVAVSEIMVYGGENQSFNSVYLNPVLFYHGAQKNEAGAGNVLPAVDFLYYPHNSFHVYASLLIDDIQIEKTRPGDLEPNEIGLITGVKWSDPFAFSGLTLSGEYTRVTNRTYKTLSFHEVFLHRNKPLGHPLGNDFDLLQIEAEQWFSADLQCKLHYSHTRRGEGSIYTPFDTPWIDYTAEQGYSEPFPTGVVETRNSIGLSARYQPSIHWGVNAEWYYNMYDNYQKVKGENETHTTWRLGLWWDGEVVFGFDNEQ
ncbi:MAG: capsule assembly Wzi family protein [candidate division KSB1 bacterium]|nr:capsule assembly Wzi family protein [candidate division KSB1 bacterium]